MTTIGYGDINIITNNERIFVLIVMFISSGMYGYTLNKISTIIATCTAAANGDLNEIFRLYN